MARRNLLQPVRYQAERRQLAAARPEFFVDPPAYRNRVWQADFTQFETTGEGTWALCGVVEDAIETAETLLGHRLIEDCVDPTTGEIVPLVVVTDNGPAMKSVAVARRFAARSHFTHVRTRHRSPWTNGVVERWFESLKYEHLYRHDIANGLDLADHVAAFAADYNATRPRQARDQKPPLDAYLRARTLKPNPPRTGQNS